MMQDLPQLVPQKVCLSCDGCCKFKEQDSAWHPKVAQEETKGQGSATDILTRELDKEHCIKAITCGGQFRCTFFHAEDHICHIYEYRPFECRLYPFLLTQKGNSPAISAHLSCPYIQETWQNEEFKSHVEELQKYFQIQEVREFIQRNLEMVRDYSEYEQEIEHLFTFKL